MAVAWVWSPDDASAGEMGRALARVGFTAQRVCDSPEGTAPGDDRPALAVLVGAAGKPAPIRAWQRIRDRHRLGDVPVLFTVDPGGLDTAPSVLEAHEVIVRPFSTAELEVRVARARRGAAGFEPAEVLTAGSLELNVANYAVSIDGDVVDFTHLEFELLKFLMKNPKRAYPREVLLGAVWGDDYIGGARTVDVHVRRIRAKLGPQHAGRLETVRSVGYRFVR